MTADDQTELASAKEHRARQAKGISLAARSFLPLAGGLLASACVLAWLADTRVPPKLAPVLAAMLGLLGPLGLGLVAARALGRRGVQPCVRQTLGLVLLLGVQAGLVWAVLVQTAMPVRQVVAALDRAIDQWRGSEAGAQGPTAPQSSRLPHSQPRATEPTRIQAIDKTGEPARSEAVETERGRGQPARPVAVPARSEAVETERGRGQPARPVAVPARVPGSPAPAGGFWGPGRDPAAHARAGTSPGDELPQYPFRLDASGCRVVTLHEGSSRSGDMLDLVIMSEGFTAAEMPVFRAAAEDIKRTFLAHNPFAGLREISTVTAIETPSAGSGIDMPPDVARRFSDPRFNSGRNESFRPASVDTYLDGSWYDPGGGSQKDIAFDTKKAFAEAARLVPGFSRRQDELMVVVNIPRTNYRKVSSYPLKSDPRDARGTYLWHEWGHHLGLGDEDFDRYWRDKAQTSSYPNKTLDGDLRNARHPWARFFTPQSVKATVLPGWDWSRPAYDPALVNGRSVLVAGLFPPTPVRGPRAHQGTAFGPGYACSMNHTGGSRRFCPVCAELMMRKWYEQLGRRFDEYAFHHRYRRVFLVVQTWHVERLQVLAGGRPLPPEHRPESYLLDEIAMWRIELSPELRRGRNRIELHGEGVVRFHDLHIVNENGALLPVEADPALAQVHPSRLYAGLDWSLAQGPLGLTVDIE